MEVFLKSIHKIKFWDCIFPLSVSLLIYLLFRTENTIINQLTLSYFSFTSFSSNVSIADWVIYNLPGALWLFAFLSILVKKNEKSIFFCLIPLGGALAIEMLQYFSITDGTYDLIDVVFYLFAWALFMLRWLVKGNKIRWFKSSEKISKTEVSILVLFFAIVILSDVC